MSEWFDYELPPRLIAQEPSARREDARLLCLDRASGGLTHRLFRDLPNLLRPGDLLILNDTRVIPARLIGVREQTGGRWEALFLHCDESDQTWEMLAQTRGYPHEGESFLVGDQFRLTLVGRTPDRHWRMRPDSPESPLTLLARFGEIPLPPYIRKGRAHDSDRERYQTVFADRPGSVAAPTAGLHFTPELLDSLQQRGVETARVTLHVGLGTFEPVKVDDPTDHVMHAEWCDVPDATVEAVRRCRRDGGRVIAVGTTSVRSLETASRSGTIEPFTGPTNLFIRPPYEFRSIDGLITNFHLPRTTLLLLVGAFTGMDALRHAYEVAVVEEYRFFSYGDAMFIA